MQWGHMHVQQVLSLDFPTNEMVALADLISLKNIDFSGSQSSDVLSEQHFACLICSSAQKRPDVQLQMHHFVQNIKL